MVNLFFIILLLSIAALVTGLVKPVLFYRFKITSRKLVVFIFGGLAIVSLVGIGITAPPKTETENKSEQAVTTTTPTPETAQQKQQDRLFLVTRVIDGDTIEIEGGQRVRYIGIDTPETVDPRKPVQCFGVEASNKNKDLVSGKRVRLEKDVSETDKYNRLLRYVYIDNLFVNLELVKEGYAYSSTYPPDVKYQNQFVEAQRLAKEQNKGLWSSCPVFTPTTPTVTTTPPLTPATTVTATPPPQQPSSCDIKGNISSGGEKIYHVLGCGSYSQTKIDEARGERWFCTEQEAVSAGWRKALNCP